jgi:hypothetical protein
MVNWCRVCDYGDVGCEKESGHKSRTGGHLSRAHDGSFKLELKITLCFPSTPPSSFDSITPARPYPENTDRLHLLHKLTVSHTDDRLFHLTVVSY